MKFMMSVALAFGVAAGAVANNKIPSQNEIMPVMTEVDGEIRPVVAEKDGDYFPVFTVKGKAPYFADAEGNSHVVYNEKTGKEYSVFADLGDGKFEPLGAGKASQAELKLAQGEEALTQPVCFGYRRYYRVRYIRSNYACYPAYSYGYYNYGYYNTYAPTYYNYGYSGYYSRSYYGGSYYRPYYGWGAVLDW